MSNPAQPKQRTATAIRLPRSAAEVAKTADGNAFTSRLAYSIAEVVNLTGVGRSLVYEHIAEGRLRVRKAGRRSLVFDGDLTAWLESLPEKRSGDSQRIKAKKTNS